MSELNIQRFVKRPVEIQAVQFTGTLENHRALDEFLGDEEHDHFDAGGWAFDPTLNRAEDDETPDLPGGTIEVRTLEGSMEASRGDWIIKGVKGEFYPCKPDIFEASYEYVGHVTDPGQPPLPGL